MITQEKIAYSADDIKAMLKTCEKYNKALDVAKKIYNSEFKPDEAAVLSKYLLLLFPELKEDNNERIRKGFIKAVSRIFKGHKLFDTDVTREEALAWLEKQNKQSSLNIPSRETILAVWELGNDWKELTNGCISTEYGTQLDYIQKHWEESSYYIWEEVTNESK